MEKKKTEGEMGIPDHLTCLLGNVYAGQEADYDPDYQDPDYWEKMKSGGEGNDRG